MSLHKLDINALSFPEATQWRIDLANSMSDTLSRRVQKHMGGTPQDVIAILIAAASDACATVCAASQDGYETEARMIAEMFRERILSSRNRAMRDVARATAANVNARD